MPTYGTSRSISTYPHHKVQPSLSEPPPHQSPCLRAGYPFTLEALLFTLGAHMASEHPLHNWSPFCIRGSTLHFRSPLDISAPLPLCSWISVCIRGWERLIHHMDAVRLYSSKGKSNEEIWIVDLLRDLKNPAVYLSQQYVKCQCWVV